MQVNWLSNHCWISEVPALSSDGRIWRDQMLRTWSIRERKLLRCVQTDCDELQQRFRYATRSYCVQPLYLRKWRKYTNTNSPLVLARSVKGRDLPYPVNNYGRYNHYCLIVSLVEVPETFEKLTTSCLGWCRDVSDFRRISAPTGCRDRALCEFPWKIGWMPHCEIHFAHGKIIFNRVFALTLKVILLRDFAKLLPV